MLIGIDGIKMYDEQSSSKRIHIILSVKSRDDLMRIRITCRKLLRKYTCSEPFISFKN